MGLATAAFLWGLAEATFFFIVPDVWLSFAGREKIAQGIRACGFALAGALLGGCLMYAWGSIHPESARQALDAIPGIESSLIEQAASDMQAHGANAIMMAPLKGSPYKIYAVQSADQGISAVTFLLITIPARLLRFLITTLCIHYALHFVLGKKTARARSYALGLGWILFYMVYFLRMGW